MSVGAVGAVGGFGPFDAEVPVGLTEFGGGAGLIEGSPLAQSAQAPVVMRNGVVVTGPGVVHAVDVTATLGVDENLGVMYRASRSAQEDPGVVADDGVSVVVPAGNGATIDPETGMSVDDLLL